MEDHALQVAPPELRQGDLQKFSPWGAAPGDVRALARQALELIPELEEKAA